MMGSGARVPLRFVPDVKIRGGAKGAGGIGFFPGAIVALRGKNGGGGWFLVTEILAVGSCAVLGLCTLLNIRVDATSESTSTKQHQNGRLFILNVHRQWTIHTGH
jgi:hypothetical protein